MNGESILRWLAPDVGNEQLELLLLGATVLKVLIVIDGFLLLSIVYLSRSKTAHTYVYNSMWTGKPSPSRSQVSRFYTPIILGLVLIASLLRMFGLDSDLWMDEVFTLVNSVRPAFGEIISIYSGDNQHTLYSILAKLSILLFGESAWALRLPALIFGVASIWAIARLARLVFGEKEAVLAALLCTFSYHHIWFSQNARGYTIVLFVSILATDCLLRGLRTGLWRYWSGYAILIALGVYAHLTTVFVAVAHAFIVAAILIKDRKLTKGWWKPAAAIGLSAWLTLHLYSLTLPQVFNFFSKPINVAGIEVVDWQSPIWLIAETLQQIGISFFDWWPALIFALVICCWIGFLFMRRDWVFTLAAILPAAMTIAILIVLERNLWPRMFFYEIGFVAILISASLVVASDFVSRKIPTRVRSSAFDILYLPALLILLASVFSLPELYQHPKQDFQAARDYVRKFSAPADTVLGLHMAGRVYNLYYAPEWPEINTVREVQRHRSKSGNTWVLYTLPGFMGQARPELVAMLEDEFEVIKVFPGSLRDGEIIIRRSRANTSEKQ